MLSDVKSLSFFPGACQKIHRVNQLWQTKRGVEQEDNKINKEMRSTQKALIWKFSNHYLKVVKQYETLDKNMASKTWIF